MLTREDVQLPAGIAFREWFSANEANLRTDPDLRESKNARALRIISIQLLPLIENNPENWESVRFLPNSGHSFEKFLHKWRTRCPETQRLFVEKIAEVFGLRHVAATHEDVAG